MILLKAVLILIIREIPYISKEWKLFKYKKDVQSISDGDLAYEKLYSALEIYQNVIKDYGNPESIEFLDSIYLRLIITIIKENR